MSRLEEIKHKVETYEDDYFISREEAEYLLNEVERLKGALEKLRDHGDNEEVVNLYHSKLYVRRVADDALKILT